MSLQSKKLRCIIVVLVCVFVSYSAAFAQTWTRMDLTGTGVSIESPVPFKLQQDKPDPFLEHQIAYVRWSFSNGGVFATVSYEKTSKDQKTPRQSMDETATLFKSNNASTVARVTDTQWKGEPAALFEETFFDKYANKEMSRRMVCFGKVGELTTINVSWDTSDPTAKALAARLFASASKTGTVAAETSKAPAANWTKLNFKGLIFETPSQASAGCRPAVSIAAVTATNICYLWGNDFTVSIDHNRYNLGVAPSPAEMSRRYEEGMAEVVSESTLKESHESSPLAVKVPGAEAVGLKRFMGLSTTGRVSKLVFIRKGAETWTVTVGYALRWEFSEEASNRVIDSLALALAAAQPAAQTPVTASDFLKRGLASFKESKDDAAEKDANEALRLDPKLADAYFLLAKVYCVKKLTISAIRTEDKGISLGGKPDYRCGRSGGPVPR